MKGTRVPYILCWSPVYWASPSPTWCS